MAQLMDLVRELKTLNARKKAGETLAPAEEARRKELKVFLRSTLEQGGSSGEAGEAAEVTGSKASAPVPRPTSSQTSSSGTTGPQRPVPVPASSSAPKPMPIRGGMPRVAPDPLDAPLDAAIDGPLDEEYPPPKPTPKGPPTSGAKPSAISVADLFGDAAPEPPKAEAPKPFVPKKNAFAIDAGSLIDDAAKSEAVGKVDPLAGRKAHASRAELEEQEARAEAALRATKKRERAQTADEAAEQLRQTEASYTPPEDAFVMEQYYGSYADEGYEVVAANAAGDLKPIDPREIELQKLDFTTQPGSGAATITVPPGLAFIDDFPQLYARRILPAPDDEVVVDSSDPNLLIPGKRKVTVHLLNGEKRQGAIRSLRRGELGFKLEPLGSGHPEELSIAQVKAVFIHLQPNTQPRDSGGRTLTVTFRDSRQVQGVSDDYQPGSPVFTLIPPAGRGQFERIIINGAAVQSVG